MKNLKILFFISFFNIIAKSEVGYGTFPLKGNDCIQAIEHAIKLGYRIIDSATRYGNLDAIGTAIAKFNRNDLFIISKVWPDSYAPEALRKDLFATLEKLKTGYLDNYLLHWPYSKVAIEPTLHEMQELKTQGLIRTIGLSNPTVNHMKRALQCGVKIDYVQIEMHPEFCDFQLLKFCNKNSIRVQAWAPLGVGRLSRDPFLLNIGKKYNKTAAQVALRWIVQHNCIPLPASKNVAHMQENIDIENFALSKQEMNLINRKARSGKRQRFTFKDPVEFADEFDFSFEECWPIK
ncbi:MAG: aldo/keto reductase [Candidatus Babeliales bacterium]|nr:aldo/keto reductase [Candidatus Babeliales bacterium]